MTFKAGKDARILVDQYDLSVFFNSIVPSFERDCYDSTVFGQNSKSYVAGLTDAGLAVAGFFEDTSTTPNIDTILSTALGAATPKVVSAFPEGMTVGNPAYMLRSNLTTYSISSIVSDLVKVSADLRAESDAFDRGVSLHALTAETGTVNGTSVDNAASSANGGVANLHVSAIAGAAPSVVVTIEHSTNNSTWATLVTFTAATAATSERIEVAAGTTVNRYLRCVITFGGTTTSITLNVNFARRG